MSKIIFVVCMFLPVLALSDTLFLPQSDSVASGCSPEQVVALNEIHKRFGEHKQSKVILLMEDNVDCHPTQIRLPMAKNEFIDVIFGEIKTIESARWNTMLIQLDKHDQAIYSVYLLCNEETCGELNNNDVPFR